MIPSWIIIGAVTFLVALGSFFITPRDVKWFANLSRPRWLVFEPLIPVIWTVIFICGAASAYIVWEKNPGSLITWLLMALYLLVEIITVAYIPTMLRFRSLKVGEVLGLIGLISGVVPGNLRFTDFSNSGVITPSLSSLDSHWYLHH
ncbi:TspO protein [Nostoc sp. DSM 114160]|jgi:benzodiazapine receptor